MGLTPYGNGYATGQRRGPIASTFDTPEPITVTLAETVAVHARTSCGDITTHRS